MLHKSDTSQVRANEGIFLTVASLLSGLLLYLKFPAIVSPSTLENFVACFPNSVLPFLCVPFTLLCLQLLTSLYVHALFLLLK